MILTTQSVALNTHSVVLLYTRSSAALARPHFPFTHVQVAFVEMPNFNFDLTLYGGDIGFLPGLEAWITTVIKDSVLRSHCHPKAVHLLCSTLLHCIHLSASFPCISSPTHSQVCFVKSECLPGRYSQHLLYPAGLKYVMLQLSGQQVCMADLRHPCLTLGLCMLWVRHTLMNTSCLSRQRNCLAYIVKDDVR